MATPTVRTVNAQNQNHLVHAASNEAGWRRYLETLSRHTGCANAFYNLSAMNCAGLAASDWHESREILPIATWKSLFPGADIKPADGCTGVYCVKSRPRGSGGGLFYVDELFPPALLVGLPPTMLRGAARVLDLSVDIAAVPLEGRAVAVAHLLDEGRRGLHDLVDVHLERGGLALHVVGRKHGAGAPGTLGAEVRLDDEAGVLIEVDPCDRHALSLRGRVGVAVHIGDVDYTVQPGLGIAP